MHFFKTLLFFLLISFFSYSQNPLITSDKIEQEVWVDSIYNSLSIDQKIGQLFTIWVATKQGPEKMDEVSSIIKKNHLGGLIFSLGNINDQAKYTNEFQSISKVPLLIGMDAEWGIGMRLDDAFSFPYNMRANPPVIHAHDSFHGETTKYAPRQIGDRHAYIF